MELFLAWRTVHVPNKNCILSDTSMRALLVVLTSAFISIALLEVLSFAVFLIRPSGNPLAFPAHEAALHIYEPQSEGHFYRVKPHYTQRFRSDEFDTIIRTNNIGLREDFDYFGEPIDIGFVGDSFTFGHGVDVGDRYSDKVRQSSAGKVVVSFAPANGSAPVSQYLYLKNNPTLVPKHLIVGLFAWNDLREDMENTEITFSDSGHLVRTDNKSAKVRSDGFIVSRGDSDEPDPAWRNFLRRTHLGSLVLIAAHRITSLTLSTSANSDEVNVPAVHSFGSKDFESGKLDDTALLSLSYVSAMNNLVTRNGGRMTMFYIPTSYRVGEYPYFCEYVSGHSKERCEDLRSTNEIGESLLDWCQSFSLNCIDPTADFRAAEDAGTKLYFEKDGHWNESGHSLAAKIINRHLGLE